MKISSFLFVSGDNKLSVIFWTVGRTKNTIRWCHLYRFTIFFLGRATILTLIRRLNNEMKSFVAALLWISRSHKRKACIKFELFMSKLFEGVWISEIMPNKRTCVMELQCSLQCPCRPAFVCNYCLIKHAGQLPGSGWLATDTQLYTECLRPPSIRVSPVLSNP